MSACGSWPDRLRRSVPGSRCCSRPVPQRARRRIHHLGGIGSGALITAQQSGLSLGVATLGTFYLTLAPHGISHAFAGVEYVQMGIVALLAVGAAALPQSSVGYGRGRLAAKM